MSDYIPVGCELQDKLEAISVRKLSSEITYDDSGNTVSANGKVVDIYADSGADYCKMDDGTTIRLDKIAAVTAEGEPVFKAQSASCS